MADGGIKFIVTCRFFMHRPLPHDRAIFHLCYILRN
ncbi:Uncharacterised protein [Vibrio cholerae]|nr:Uncharacterised protein [Vibrio cholerae]